MALLSSKIVDRYPALSQREYVKYFLASLAAVGATQLVTFGQLWLGVRDYRIAHHVGMARCSRCGPEFSHYLIRWCDFRSL